MGSVNESFVVVFSRASKEQPAEEHLVLTDLTECVKPHGWKWQSWGTREQICNVAGDEAVARLRVALRALGVSKNTVDAIESGEA